MQLDCTAACSCPGEAYTAAYQPQKSILRRNSGCDKCNVSGFIVLILRRIWARARASALALVLALVLPLPLPLALALALALPLVLSLSLASALASALALVLSLALALGARVGP